MYPRPLRMKSSTRHAAPYLERERLYSVRASGSTGKTCQRRRLFLAFAIRLADNNPRVMPPAAYRVPPRHAARYRLAASAGGNMHNPFASKCRVLPVARSLRLGLRFVDFTLQREKEGKSATARVYDAGSRRVRAFCQFRRISRTSFVSLSRGGPRHVSNDAVTIHLMARGPP